MLEESAGSYRVKEGKGKVGEQSPSKRREWQGCREHSAVKRASTIPEISGSQHPCPLPHSSRGPDALFWPPEVSAHTWDVLTQTQTHTLLRVNLKNKIKRQWHVLTSKNKKEKEKGEGEGRNGQNRKMNQRA